MADTMKELETKKEKRPMEPEWTRDRRVYIPPVDIVETQDTIELSADMSGVDETSVTITLEGDVLMITGSVEPATYEGYRLVYNEYDIGDYRRSFNLSDTIDHDSIEATVKNGVLRLRLPKAEPVKPKKITVKSG